MGGGWNNGISELTEYSRPLESGQGWECHGNKEDASGTCSAVCCDSYHYDSIVMTRAGVLSNSLTPVCPQTYTVVGGGFLSTKKNSDTDSLHPSEDLNGWKCYDDEADTVGSSCFAVCAKRKDPSDPMTCKTVSVTAGQDKGTSVLCPKGSFVTGGGFEDKGGKNKDQDASMPTPADNGWYCEKTGNKDGLTANTCYARCCTLPEVTLLAALSSRSSVAATSSSGASSIISSLSSAPVPVPSSATSAVTSVSSSPASTPFSSEASSLSIPLFSSPAPTSAQSLQVSSSSFVVPLPSAVSSMRLSARASVQTAPSSSQVQPVAGLSSFAGSPPPSSSSAAPAPTCSPDTCRKQGDAYCRMNGNLRCAEIATEPCFVCLAEIGFAQPSSSPPLSSLPLAPTVETESSLSSHATMSSLHSASSVAQTSSPVVRFSSSAPGVLPAILLTPWYPAASEAHVALGASGPGTLGVMAAGAASGLLWMRKRRK